MAGDASLSITPVMKWNFERSCYRWLVTRHPAQFERMDFTAQILQSASRARKAFYECGWEEAKVLIRPSDGKFERTPFFDTIIRRGLRNSTRFDASTLTEEEVEALGMHRDESLGSKLQIRHFRSRRRDSKRDGANDVGGSNNVSPPAVMPPQRQQQQQQHHQHHRYQRSEGGGDDGATDGDVVSVGRPRSPSSCSPTPPSPSLAVRRHHPHGVGAPGRSLGSASVSSTTTAGSSSHDANGLSIGVPSRMSPAAGPYHCQQSGSERERRPPLPQTMGSRGGAGGSDRLNEHPRWGRESVWQPIHGAGSPVLGAATWGQNPRPQWRVQRGADGGVRPAALGVVGSGTDRDMHDRDRSMVPETIPATSSTRWDHQCHPLGRAVGGLWVGQGPPHREAPWDVDERAVGVGAWERVRRGGMNEHADGDRFGRATFAGSVGVGARHPRHEDVLMTGRDFHGASGRQSSNSIGGGGYGDVSQPAVEHDARFGRHLDARGSMNMDPRSAAADARVVRDTRAAAPEAPDSGDGALLAQGYMRLAAMRSSCGSSRSGGGGGGSERRVSASPAPRGIPETGGRSSPSYLHDRPYRAAEGPTFSAAAPGTSSALIPAAPKRPATGESLNSTAPYRGSGCLPAISQVIPDARKSGRASAEIDGRSRSPSEDRARPLKKRRCGSSGSNTEASGNVRAGQPDAADTRNGECFADGDGYVTGEKYHGQDAHSARRSSSAPPELCDQLTKELVESEQELLSARRELDAARRKYDGLSRAHRAKQDQLLAVAGQRAAYSSPNSPDEKNGPAASTDDCTAAATSPTLTKKNSVCCARDRSASRPPSQGSSETAGKGDAAASPASTTADKAMGDCKAEAEILVGLGKVPMNSSPSSSSPSPKKHFDTDPLADKTVESQTGSSDKPRSRDNGKERLADTCGELSPRESSYPSARRTAASESHSAEVDAMGSDLDRDGALTCQRQQEKQKQHLSFGSRAPVRTDAGPESHIGNTSNDHDDGDNTSLSGDSAATTTPRSGVIAAGLRVTVAASSSSEKSSSSKAPPGDSDVGFLPPTAGNETASRNSRALPPIVKTPGSPSASGETDSEHSDTVAPGAVGDRGTGGDAASCDAASGKKLSAERSVEGETKHGGGSSGGFRRNPGGSDSGYRRFHHSISEWERRSNHDEDTVGRRVRGGGGYMPPLVRLAAVAAAGGRSDGYGVHAGAGGVLHERYAYM